MRQTATPLHGETPRAGTRLTETCMDKVRSALWQVRNRYVERVAAFGKRFLYKHHLLWLDDLSWLEPYAKYLAGDRITNAHGGGTETRILDRRFTLMQFARSIRRLKGSTAECGVRFGVGSAIICKALDNTYSGEDGHYGFDSFEGLPLPSDKDQDRSGYQVWRKAGLQAPIQIATERLSDFHVFCHLIKGWMPDSFDVAANRRFRYVHIDVDLYQSTWDSLAFFYPRMVQSGVIILDDHGFISCPGARKAAEEFFADKPEPIIELATGQAIVIKAAKQTRGSGSDCSTQQAESA